MGTQLLTARLLKVNLDFLVSIVDEDLAAELRSRLFAVSARRTYARTVEAQHRQQPVGFITMPRECQASRKKVYCLSSAKACPCSRA